MFYFKFSATKNCICINFLCSWIWAGLIKSIMYKLWIVSELTYLRVLWISLMIVRLVRVWMQWTCGNLPHCMRQLPSHVLRCAPCCWPMAQTLTWSTATPSPSLMLHPLGNCRNASSVRTFLTVWMRPVYVPSCLNTFSVCTFLSVWMHLVYLPSCLSKHIQCTYLLDCLNASSVCIFLSVWTHPMYVPSCLSVAHLLLSCDGSCKRRI